MEKDKSVWIEFIVKVREDQYSWNDNGEASLDIKIPVKLLDNLDAANILTNLLPAAVKDHYERISTDED